jgi:1,4-alpha-glucan branching enzyme
MGEPERVITKRKKLDKVQVTFALEPRDEPVFVSGTFNDWAREPLKKAKDGQLKATVSASPGDVIEFRYVTASDEWFDDDSADEHVWNEHGTKNGRVHV